MLHLGQLNHRSRRASRGTLTRGEEPRGGRKPLNTKLVKHCRRPSPLNKHSSNNSLQEFVDVCYGSLVARGSSAHQASLSVFGPGQPTAFTPNAQPAHRKSFSGMPLVSLMPFSSYLVSNDVLPQNGAERFVVAGHICWVYPNTCNSG